VDESTGPAVATWLRRQGHEVFSVYDQARGMDDEGIIEKAITSVKVIHWPCGDHGYDGVEEYELRADKGNIYAVRRQYECGENGRRGRLVKQENL
jgi:hypothetical protein